jgi:hypothetical protein
VFTEQAIAILGVTISVNLTLIHLVGRDDISNAYRVGNVVAYLAVFWSVIFEPSVPLHG